MNVLSNRTKVINLFGGPGISKSTTAADIFSKLKRAGKEVELVREFAKEAFAWKGRKIEPYHQLYILGNQIDRELPLYGKVDYIITDSPIYLCGFYTEYYNKSASITEVIKETLAGQQDKCQHYNFNLNRLKPYNPKGRFETEEEAKAIDVGIKEYLSKHSLPFDQIIEDDEKKAEIIIKLVTNVYQWGDNDSKRT